MFSAVTGQAEVIALPALDEVQILRDEVARADWAIAQRTSEMAGLATECEGCRDVLVQAAEAADIRTLLSGGVWEPWGDFQERADADTVVELPGEVAEAPYQVGPLSAYMWSTAVFQMDEVAAQEGLEPEERQALASILAGRMASARLLANHYGVDLGAQVSSLAPEAAVASVPVEEDEVDKDALANEDSGEDGGADAGDNPNASTSPDAGADSDTATGADKDGGALAQSDGGAAVQSGDAGQSGGLDGAQSGLEEEETRDFAAEALVAYDCVRSTVLMTPEEELAPLVPFDLAQNLNSRSKMLVREGTRDDRGIRCLIPSPDTATIMGRLLMADIALIGADSPELRQMAVGYIRSDVTSWVSVSPQTVPTTSVLPIGEAEETRSNLADQGTPEDDSPQS